MDRHGEDNYDSIRLTRVGVAFAPDYFELLAPAFVEGGEGPFDAGGEVAEDGFGGGVDAEGGGYKVEVRG